MVSQPTPCISHMTVTALWPAEDYETRALSVIMFPDSRHMDGMGTSHILVAKMKVVFTRNSASRGTHA